MTYKKAGVDIDKADEFVKKIWNSIRKTDRPEVLGKIGGLSGLFMPRLRGMEDPVLVSSTDGVGTKLLIAEMLDKYDTVGIDLVAMCADDVAVTSARSTKRCLSSLLGRRQKAWIIGELIEGNREVVFV